jgi:hypothetical protein
MPCRRGPGSAADPHEVTVNADWSVETGHDLALERIAAALGGQLSCLDFADRTIPALRQYSALLERSELPPIRSQQPAIAGIGGVQRNWHSLSGADCGGCSPHRRSAMELATHLRDPAHWARVFGLDREQREFLTLATEPRLIIPGSTALRVRADWEQLWATGIHPDRIVDIHQNLGLSLPLDAEAYLYIILDNLDQTWLSSYGAGDREMISYLATTHSPRDATEPEVRLAFLSAGVSQPTAARLMATDYTVDEVLSLSARTHLSVERAASIFATWDTRGCRPSVDAVVQLLDRRPKFRYPDTVDIALARQLAQSQQGSADIDPTVIGVAIAALGRSNARQLIHLGARTLDDFVNAQAVATKPVSGSNRPGPT